MKKLTLALAVIFLTVLVSCKKENSTTDYSSVRLKQIIYTSNNADYDTTKYYYDGNNILEVVSYNYINTMYYSSYSKTNAPDNRYNITLNNSNSPSNTHTGFYKFNTQGLIDSSYLYYVVGSKISNTSKYYYNSDGYVLRTITDYQTYVNDVSRVYDSENKTLYRIYNFKSINNPSTNYKDSTVYEYTNTKELADFETAFQYKFGKFNKYLLKKSTTYRLSTGGNLRGSVVYEYKLDDKGLVVEKVLKNYNASDELTSTTKSIISYY